MIEADGRTLHRTRGSHRHYVHPEKLGVVTIAGKPGKDLACRHREKHPEAGGDQMEVTVSTYAVIIERAEDGGYGAWSPDLPGCIALGDTEAEALSEMREAMHAHLQILHERGEAVPEPSTVSATTLQAA
ncbi:putative RNase H-like HicB family nuclease [Spinactinospora alkalitolerans]|uniref:Putative RNase H-like HicB family nuclease n=1 Tax=Spinactinospora alkalitolerans TaxID=687207 RepID=A0A852U6F2_9ACTN|nr:type II toxin-antitoxin system HicB family antitoxin [Spinactinospora alkalitolerans]NYE49654.1 putative RNase H-like HicB family nuclease [Spinactinospora alkalitolerans]